MKSLARNQSNRQNLHDDLAKVKSVSFLVIKSIKTYLVVLTKPGEQFIHAFTEPTNKGQKLFVGTVSGPMHVYHIMIIKPGNGDSVGENSLFTTCSLLSLA